MCTAAHHFLGAAARAAAVACLFLCLLPRPAIAQGGDQGSDPAGFTALGDRIFFRANDGTNGNEPWISEGTPEGTAMLKDINLRGSSNPGWFAVLGDRLFFSANDGTHGFYGYGLWVTDGTPDGTVMLKEINPGGNANPGGFTALGNRLFFSADDGTHGVELWVTDGTPDGTVIPTNINPGGSSNPGWFTALGDRLFFSADDGTYGYELWVADGTLDGTMMLKDINPGGSSNPGWFTALGDRLFFSADDGTHGVELWVTDGTPDGTVMLKDMNPEGSSNPGPFTALGHRLFFSVNYDELWVSDGTPEGTAMLKDMNPDGSSFPEGFTALGDRIFFSAYDGTHGIEPWVTDGTPEGTVMLKDINPGGSSNPGWFTALGDRLFFSADDGTHGVELWVTNGTPEGTVMLKDINPGGSSNPGPFTALGDRLFFSADDGTHGNEPWVTDGTLEGTVKLKNINPNPIANFIRGDANQDGKVDFADESSILRWLNLYLCMDGEETEAPACLASLNIDGGTYVGFEDFGLLFRWIWNGAPPPPAPFPVPGSALHGEPTCRAYNPAPPPKVADFVLDLETPTFVPGGDLPTFQTFATLTTMNNTIDRGAEGWTLSIGCENLTILSLTTEGTAGACDCSKSGNYVVDPNLLVDGKAQGDGAVAVVLLNLRGSDFCDMFKLTPLPREGTERLLGLTVKLKDPAQPGRLFFADGKVGKGQPIANMAVLNGTAQTPTLGEVVIPIAAALQRPGDASQDGFFNITDVIWILGHLFLGTQPTLPCEGGTAGSPGPGELSLLDFSDDSQINIVDPIAMLSFLFLGGDPPRIGADCTPIPGCPDLCSP